MFLSPQQHRLLAISALAFTILHSALSGDAATPQLSVFDDFALDITRRRRVSSSHQEIDVSNSFLDQQRLESILHQLPRVDSQSLLAIKAQFCRLTPELVASQLLQNQLLSNYTLSEIDLGWNKLIHDDDGVTSGINQAFHTALRTTLRDTKSLTRLQLDCCGLGPATVRVIAKGWVERYETCEDTETVAPLQSLSLCRNLLGDPGAAALAAAVRTIRSKPGTSSPVVEHLDCSACHIQDAGAEALGLALNDDSVRHLNVAYNALGTVAVRALGRTPPTESLDVSGNEGITDSNVGPLVDAVAEGRLRHLIIRSCALHAGGAEKVGLALATMIGQGTESVEDVIIDLSGNPLGILRKRKKSTNYSASRIKSTVTATASAYMTQGFGLLKKGLGSSVSTLESDDEEEDEIEDDEESKEDRCGLKALANAFLSSDANADTPICSRSIYLGLRHTFCDIAGAEALAALVVTARERGVRISLDMRLNPILGEDMIDALHGGNEELLSNMADRHFEVLEVIEDTKRRTSLATKEARARQEREAEMEDNWAYAPDTEIASDTENDYDDEDSHYY